MKRGGEIMDKDKHEVLVLFPRGNTGELEDVYLSFKRLFLDWLRFFRDNIDCPYALRPPDCITRCSLERYCSETERVWGLWLDTLEAEDRSLVD